jgi:hypothetical protein
MALSIAQLQALAASVGFPASAAPTAAAIAMAESSGNPSAIGDNGTSFGLWQIHTPAWPQFDATSLLDPNYNAQAAFHIYSTRGGSFQDWSTYTTSDPNLSYKRFVVPYAPSVWPVVKAVAIVAAVAVVASEVIQRLLSSRR